MNANSNRLTCLTIFLAIVSTGGIFSSQAIAEQPNILWLSAEDISPHFGCYGDPHAITPAIDQLASEGVLYTHAFTTAGVCSPCRSGIITGMYQTSIGTHHMRCTAKLPDFIKPFPIYLGKAGYFCTNNSKTDYQFKHDKSTWDESGRKAHWRNRTNKTQPFFAVFNFTGCHESGIAGDEKCKKVTQDLNPSERQDANKLTTLPPYYPDTLDVRDDWKRNYELITAMDHWAADLIEQLKQDGLYENTIIMFWSDHGVGLPRAKRWLYDSGTRIPLVVRVPKKYRTNDQGKPGSVSEQLISSIDLGPTVLNLANVEVPDHMQGQAFLGQKLSKPREYVFGARDRMDERYDIIRSVRDKRFRYIRNYEPLKTYYQYMNTPEKGRLMKEIRRVAVKPNIDSGVAQFLAKTKPAEELYDLIADPHEMKNLANDPESIDVLKRMRGVHINWVRETRDLGLIPESILLEQEEKLGTQFAILSQPGEENLSRRLGEIAGLASGGVKSLPQLLQGLGDSNEAIRYWGATGIGNIGIAATKSKSNDATETAQTVNEQIRARLSDSSATVRVAAARAMARLGKPKLALPVLTVEMESDQPWVRFQAAIVLDEMDEAARPAISILRNALTDQPNKYITRVANRALNQLEGTARAVK